MNTPLIGINGLIKIKPEQLEASLEAIRGFGFDCMEFNLASIPLIAHGEPVEPYVDYVRGIFERSPLKITGHIGEGLDLRNLREPALHKSVLAASIDVCARLGIDRLTLHFSKASPILKEEEAFFEAHAEAADYAASRGVLLLMENIEIEDYRKVIDMVRRMNHDNFKMTLDIGHLYLSVRYFGGDFLQAVRECAPLVRHTHINDNTGRFEPMRLENFDLYKTLHMGTRTALGSGDIHLPPLWGKIPIREAVEILRGAGFDGIFLCEYENDLYMPFGEKIQQDMRRLVGEVYGG